MVINDGTGAVTIALAINELAEVDPHEPSLPTPHAQRAQTETIQAVREGTPRQLLRTRKQAPL